MLEQFLDEVATLQEFLETHGKNVYKFSNFIALPNSEPIFYINWFSEFVSLNKGLEVHRELLKSKGWILGYECLFREISPSLFNSLRNINFPID